MRKISQHACLCLSWVVLTACNSSLQSKDGSSDTLVTPESDYCAADQNLNGSTYTITGNAQFESRVTRYGISYSGQGTALSGWYLDNSFRVSPIARAEVHVYDSGGALIQCGETDLNGQFSLSVPAAANRSYTLQVLSRASNEAYKVSVLNDLTNNKPYTVSQNFSVGNSSPGNIGTLTASGDEHVDGQIAGGAFNIMNAILRANNFLRASAGSVGFTVTPKVSVFWKAGFNPNTYRGGPAGSGISYYSPGTHQLFILGGINGDVAFSDTDHFDDSVIMHEYGHFLEDIFGKSNSPGGSHNGDAVIDPRLAWSEGWANYIQAAIKTYTDANDTTKSSYIDTYGYKSSTNATSGFGQNIVFDLTADAANMASSDAPRANNEGLFREVSISRSLYKASSPTQISYVYNGTRLPSVNLPFKYIWQIFSTGDSSTTPAVNGFHSENIYFRSMGLFNYLLNSLIVLHQGDDPTTYAKLSSLSTVLSQERQPLDNLQYGAALVRKTSGSCNISLQPSRNLSSEKPLTCAPLSDPTCSDYAYASNQLSSNDFYRYCYDGSTNNTLTLSFTQAGSPTVDLNMTAYVQDYVYFEDVYGLAGQKSPFIVAATSWAPGTNNGTKSFSFAGLPAACYMINIKANTTNNDGTDKTTAQITTTTLQYSLSDNGGLLCPQAP